MKQKQFTCRGGDQAARTKEKRNCEEANVRLFVGMASFSLLTQLK